MDAHKPFIPEYAVDGPTVDISKEKLAEINDYARERDPPSEEHRELLWNLYEANVRYLDRGLARALGELRTVEWYDDALVIVVADHGELFGEHGYMWHPMTIDPVEELIDTPLAVKYPGGGHAGVTFDHRVHHADILATVTSYLDTQECIPEEAFQLQDDSDRRTISKSNTAVRVTGPDGYAVRRRDETRDEHGAVTDTVREQLANASFPEVRTTAGNVRGIEDVERIEQLRALGYR